jgi:hypothetical protein
MAVTLNFHLATILLPELVQNYESKKVVPLTADAPVITTVYYLTFLA